jgi:hypothetical protein
VKNFLFVICIGIIAGVIFTWGFVIAVSKLPDIFADAFFYPTIKQATVIIKDPMILIQPETGQYSIKAVDQLISTSTTVVYADLGSMTITTYKNGQEQKKYQIQSIGREGTAWQTPLGKFDMNYKIENHFSSIGHVWMPYSMHFFGNYFIHGWPYYASGVPVAEGYSGGCIRLNTADAQELFQFVDTQTQLIVSNSIKQSLASDQLIYKVQHELPDINSKFMVVDMDTGEVVASKDSSLQIPIMSFTKIMTGLISLETLNQYQDTILYQNIVHVSDLLYALLLTDSDEAGDMLFEHKNKSQYIKDMNTRAKTLGMNQTTYTDVTGDAQETVSSLDDTFRLLQYAYLHKPFLLKVLSTDSHTKHDLVITSHHPFIKHPDFKGGFVDTMGSQAISLFKVSDEKLKDKTFAIIVFDSFDVTSDTQALYDWLRDAVFIK